MALRRSLNPEQLVVAVDAGPSDHLRVVAGSDTLPDVIGEAAVPLLAEVLQRGAEIGGECVGRAAAICLLQYRRGEDERVLRRFELLRSMEPPPS